MKEKIEFDKLKGNHDLFNLRQDLMNLTSISNSPKVSDVIFKERKFCLTDIERCLLDIKTSFYSDVVTEIFHFNIRTEKHEFIHSALVLDFRCYSGIKESFLRDFLREGVYIDILDKSYDVINELVDELVSKIKAYDITRNDVIVEKDFLGKYITIDTHIDWSTSLCIKPSNNISIKSVLGKIFITLRKGRGKELDLFLKTIDFKPKTFAFIKNLHSSL